MLTGRRASSRWSLRACETPSQAEVVFKDDATVQRLCRERYGIEDMAEVACDPWYYGERFSEFGYCTASRYWLQPCCWSEAICQLSFRVWQLQDVLSYCHSSSFAVEPGTVEMHGRFIQVCGASSLATMQIAALC
jgi:hypothetical protein